MKKVLHLLASNKFSGAENVVCTIIENFKDEYDMVYCSPDGEIKKTLEKKNIQYFPLNKMSIFQLRKVIKEYKPDIIHAHDYTASVFATFSGFKGKIISHLHNNCPFAKSWNLKTILYNITIAKYTTVIGVSDMVYEEAIFKKRMKNKFVKLYNFVDKNMILSKLKEYKIDEEYDLFFIGRLTEQKDPFKFIDIVNELHKKGNQVTAVMIGDGDLKNECQELINEYKLNKYVKLLGFVSNPFPIIKNCKIGIMPSKWEGFGLTAIEGMIIGKPVLNSGAGGLKEIFSENPEFICGDNEYTGKILFLLNDKTEYVKFLNNTHKISKRFIKLENYINSLKNIYGKRKK